MPTQGGGYPARIVATVAAGAAVNQMSVSDGHQAECVIKLAIGQQARVGSDAQTVELELEAVVEIEPESIGLGLTLWLRHHRLDPMKQDAESDSSNGIGAAKFNGAYGKCGLKSNAGNRASRC